MMLLPIAISCGRDNRSSTSASPENLIEMKYARYLRLEDCGSYTKATIVNPWDTTQLLGAYLLVPEGTPIPASGKDEVIIHTPIKSAVIFNSVHGSLLEELGSNKSICGIVDTQYIDNDSIKNRITKGEIADCGNYNNVNTERIISLSPQVLLQPPYDNGTGNLTLPKGINIIKCADYMEQNPLGRAEWIRFYGMLFDKSDIADSLFNRTEEEYLALKHRVAKIENKPIVIFDRIYGSTWDMPAKKSTLGYFIEDAGGENPFEHINRPGAIHLSPEKVLTDAHNADFWFIRYYGGTPPTKATLAKESDFYPRFKAWKDGKIYVTDTSTSHIFEDYAFHPQWLLADMISILHPETRIIPPQRYFSRVKQ